MITKPFALSLSKCERGSTSSQETAFLYLKNQYVTSIEKYKKLRQTAAVSW
jgi:hypothetical protein